MFLLFACPPELPSALHAALGGKGTKVVECPTPDAVLAHAAQGAHGIFAGAGEAAGELLRQLKANKLTVPVVVVGPAQPAVGAKAIRMGAVEYVTLPAEPHLLKALVEKLAPPEPLAEAGPIAVDPLTLALLEQAKTFAGSTATVLIRGESGTGKEVFSRYVHHHSPRATKPFVAINCAAIPANLLESELFGHEKGAFSGALTKKLGKFQQAEGGTLLLDEITEMDLALQAKLLRAIQERVIDPVGSEQPVPVNIRLIATTNRALEGYVAEGKFREDLYFRLNVVSVEVPPLRERKADILPLARHFAATYRAQNGLQGAVSFSPDAEAKLQTCYWKGNVRELENTLHRAVLLAGKGTQILPEHIVLSPMSLQHMQVDHSNLQAAEQPVQGRAAPLAAAAAAAYAGGGTGPQPFLPRRLAEAERDLITQTLSYTQGNRQYAADLLGISLLHFQEKLAAVGLV